MVEIKDIVKKLKDDLKINKAINIMLYDFEETDKTILKNENEYIKELIKWIKNND